MRSIGPFRQPRYRRTPDKPPRVYTIWVTGFTNDPGPKRLNPNGKPSRIIGFLVDYKDEDGKEIEVGRTDQGVEKTERELLDQARDLALNHYTSTLPGGVFTLRSHPESIMQRLYAPERPVDEEYARMMSRNDNS